MDIVSIIIFLAIGAVAGWLAGNIMKGGSFGVVGNMLVGIVGAVVGGVLFSALGMSPGGGMIGSLIVATIGAVLFLFVARLIKKV